MAHFLLRRFIGGAITIVASTLVVFFVVRVIPGDPLAAALGQRTYDPVVAESLRRLYGLNEPIPQQYIEWISSLLSGEMGYSLLSQTSINQQVLERIPRTLYLMGGGIAVAIAFALPAGILAARRQGRVADTTLTSIATILLATPEFFLGILLILLFAVTLRWLPAAGFADPARDLPGFLRSMILPWFTIGLTSAAFTLRVLRSSLLDVLGRNYIRTARARGLNETAVMTRHALRNASIPTVTVVGLEIGFLLGGSIIIEVLFSYPGMGRMMIDAITQRDYPVVQASLLFYAIGFVVVNLTTDILYSVLDPRVRVS